MLEAIALEVNEKVNVVGINLMNEPDNSDRLQGWYESTITSIRGTLAEKAGGGPPPSQLPIYIDDARDPNWYSKLVGKREDFVVMDRHIYRCFTQKDKEKSGVEQADDIRGHTREDLRKWHKAAHGNIIIGEWSAGLDPQGMPHGADSGEKDRQRRVFVQAQREVYSENAAGNFFWCYKKEKGWDAGWSSRDASRAAILPEWVGGANGDFKDSSEDSREDLLKQAIGASFCSC